MRPIHTARLDRVRPVLVLTRERVRPHMRRVTIAPITTTVRGLSTEVSVGAANGLSALGVVSCDNIETIRAEHLGPQIGVLLDAQEAELTAAIGAAFDLA